MKAGGNEGGYCGKGDSYYKKEALVMCAADEFIGREMEFYQKALPPDILEPLFDLLEAPCDNLEPLFDLREVPRGILELRFDLLEVPCGMLEPFFDLLQVSCGILEPLFDLPEVLYGIPEPPFGLRYLRIFKQLKIFLERIFFCALRQETGPAKNNFFSSNNTLVIDRELLPGLP